MQPVKRGALPSSQHGELIMCNYEYLTADNPSKYKTPFYTVHHLHWEQEST
jgi:hypothetical protein